MNCKPGDLAFVLGDSRYAGMIVRILHLAPCVSYILPDGYPASPAKSECWVIEFPHPVRVRLEDGGYRMTQYAAVQDRKLKPIRPDTEPQEITRELETTE